MRVLLHACCGPCSCFPAASLREEGHDVTAFFFNPNIHPYREFEKRLETMERFAKSEGIELIVDDSYDIHSYLERALRAETRRERCSICYRLRLDEAAREARLRGFDTFSSTLLVSPFQAHDAVREAGAEAAVKNGIGFLYRDFRPGWSRSVEIAREKALYRQGYCGCVFSEVERYRRARRSG